MNFIIRYFFKKYIKPEDEATHLIDLVNSSAYQVFLDKRFRELVKFDEQAEEEQNRIFNELVVTGLVFSLFFIEDRESFAKAGRKEFWKNVSEKIPVSMADGLAKMDIPKGYVSIWKKLLKKRTKEYLEKRKITESVWREEFSKIKKSEKNKGDILRIETVAIGSLMHIARNEERENEKFLRNHLKAWLYGLGQNLEKKVGW